MRDKSLQGEADYFGDAGDGVRPCSKARSRTRAHYFAGRSKPENHLAIRRLCGAADAQMIRRPTGARAATHNATARCAKARGIISLAMGRNPARVGTGLAPPNS